MELRVLKYFVEVAKAKNMTLAAEILHVSPSLLSREIKNLEDELGKQLFTRKSRSIELTEPGILFRQRAEEIILLEEKTVAEFKNLDEVTGGDIHVGAAEADGFKFFARFLHEMKKTLPNLRCHLYSSDTAAVTYKLERGLLDFAIISHGNIDLKKYNFVTLPTKNVWGVLMKKNSPLAAKEKIFREDILNVPLIVSRQGLEEELFDWFGADVEKLNIVATSDLLFNASILLQESSAYLLGYDKIIFNSELCFRPLEPVVESPMHVIWRKNSAFTPLQKILIANLKKTF